MRVKPLASRLGPRFLPKRWPLNEDCGDEGGGKRGGNRRIIGESSRFHSNAVSTAPRRPDRADRLENVAREATAALAHAATAGSQGEERALPSVPRVALQHLSGLTRCHNVGSQRHAGGRDGSGCGPRRAATAEPASIVRTAAAAATAAASAPISASAAADKAVGRAWPATSKPPRGVRGGLGARQWRARRRGRRRRRRGRLRRQRRGRIRPFECLATGRC
eukprot:365200-Chlamydomonas_euryale.AAC.10